MQRLQTSWRHAYVSDFSRELYRGPWIEPLDKICSSLSHRCRIDDLDEILWTQGFGGAIEPLAHRMGCHMKGAVWSAALDAMDATPIDVNMLRSAEMSAPERELRAPEEHT
jgi:hypothetical protein